MKYFGLFLVLFTIIVSGCEKKGNDEILFEPLLCRHKIWSNGLAYYNHIERDILPVRSEFIKIGMDTIINSEKWFIVCSSSDKHHNSWQNRGYIKEVDNKVFYKSNSDDMEILLYDFSVNVGDKFILDGYTSEFKVDSIKKLPLLNGNFRKHYFISNNSSPSNENVVWIEGIGSIKGFFDNSPLMTLGGFGILLCVEEAGILIFKDTIYNFNTCFFENLDAKL